MKNEIINDENGISIWIRKPNQWQFCQTKIKGEEGYHARSLYINGYFETYKDEGNRMIITRWKADLWLPIQIKNS